MGLSHGCPSGLTAHSSDDQQTKYRSADELEAEKGRDALPRFREQLMSAGVLTEAKLSELATEIIAVVNDATDYAEGEPDPDPATALEHVYADGVEGTF